MPTHTQYLKEKIFFSFWVFRSQCPCLCVFLPVRCQQKQVTGSKIPKKKFIKVIITKLLLVISFGALCFFCVGFGRVFMNRWCGSTCTLGPPNLLRQLSWKTGDDDDSEMGKLWHQGLLAGGTCGGTRAERDKGIFSGQQTFKDPNIFGQRVHAPLPPKCPRSFFF